MPMTVHSSALREKAIDALGNLDQVELRSQVNNVGASDLPGKGTITVLEDVRKRLLRLNQSSAPAAPEGSLLKGTLPITFDVYAERSQRPQRSRPRSAHTHSIKQTVPRSRPSSAHASRNAENRKPSRPTAPDPAGRSQRPTMGLPHMRANRRWLPVADGENEEEVDIPDDNSPSPVDSRPRSAQRGSRQSPTRLSQNTPWVVPNRYRQGDRPGVATRLEPNSELIIERVRLAALWEKMEDERAVASEELGLRALRLAALENELSEARGVIAAKDEELVGLRHDVDLLVRRSAVKSTANVGDSTASPATSSSLEGPEPSHNVLVEFQGLQASQRNSDALIVRLRQQLEQRDAELSSTRTKLGAANSALVAEKRSSALLQEQVEQHRSRMQGTPSAAETIARLEAKERRARQMASAAIKRAEHMQSTSAKQVATLTAQKANAEAALSAANAKICRLGKSSSNDGDRLATMTEQLAAEKSLSRSLSDENHKLRQAAGTDTEESRSAVTDALRTGRLTSRISELEGQLAVAKQANLDSNAEVAAINGKLSDVYTALEKREAEVSRLSVELQQAEQRWAQARISDTDLSLRESVLAQQVTELESKRTIAMANVDDIARLQLCLETAEEEKAALSSQIESLSEQLLQAAEAQRASNCVQDVVASATDAASVTGMADDPSSRLVALNADLTRELALNADLTRELAAAKQQTEQAVKSEEIAVAEKAEVEEALCTLQVQLEETRADVDGKAELEELLLQEREWATQLSEQLAEARLLLQAQGTPLETPLPRRTGGSPWDDDAPNTPTNAKLKARMQERLANSPRPSESSQQPVETSVDQTELNAALARAVAAEEAAQKAELGLQLAERARVEAESLADDATNRLMAMEEQLARKATPESLPAQQQPPPNTGISTDMGAENADLKQQLAVAVATQQDRDLYVAELEKRAIAAEAAVETVKAEAITAADKLAAEQIDLRSEYERDAAASSLRITELERQQQQFEDRVAAAETERQRQLERSQQALKDSRKAEEGKRKAIDAASAAKAEQEQLRVELLASQVAHAEVTEKLHQQVAAAEEEVGTVLNNMALLLKKEGKLVEAQGYYERALALREVHLGPDHVDLTPILINMGALHYKQDQKETALEIFERALKIRTTSLGAEHPQTASCKTWVKKCRPVN